MIDGDFTPRGHDSGFRDDTGFRGDTGYRGRRQPQRSAWAKAKIRLLEYWDYPPAALFWLVLTAGTITVLKMAGL